MGCSLRLQRFCWCCTLRTGTLVIGTLGWLNTLFQIFLTPGSMQANRYGHSENQADYYLYARIGTCLISILVHVLLIVGVHKNNNKFMVPWLVLQCLGCIAISIIALTCFGRIFFVTGELVVVLISTTVALLLMGALAWYCWLCVWSHYMDLNDTASHSSNTEDSPTDDNGDVSPPPYDKVDAPLA